MPLSLSGEIRETFRKAALQHEAARGLKGDDWKQYRLIQDDHDKRARLERRDYANEYDTRVEQARKRLVDDAGKKKRALTHRLFARDGFDKEAIDRQAHRIVRAYHVSALAWLDDDRNARINALLEEAAKRRELGDQLKQDFEKAADRRSGPDRRQGPSR